MLPYRLSIFGLLLWFAPMQLSAASVASKITPIIDFTLNSETTFEKFLKSYNDGITSDYVYIAAHRGGKETDEVDQAPGNSIVNIDNAISKGFDIYESDIEILLGGPDEVLVVFHDNHFNALTNTQVPDDLLVNATLEYAQSLRLTYTSGNASNEVIPTLEDFLRAAKGKIIVKFDLKAAVTSNSRLIEIFETVKRTGTSKQVLIRGGQNELDVAFDGGYDTSMIMRRFSSEPSNAALIVLRDKYKARAISIPGGASAATVLNAKNNGMLVEVHELQGVSSMNREAGWAAALDAGVRQFHSFKPSLLKAYLDGTDYRVLD